MAAVASPAGPGASSVAELNTSLAAVADRLQAALAKLGGAGAPSQQLGDPAVSRALDFLGAGVAAPEVVHVATATVHEQLQRLFGFFATGGRLSALGFRKLVRASQLSGERCNDVSADLIFAQVVKRKGERMTVADMVIGLSMVAKRLYPQQRTQSAAFHQLLSEQLLPWMLQLDRSLSATAGAPRP